MNRVMSTDMHSHTVLFAVDKPTFKQQIWKRSEAYSTKR